MAPSAPVPMGLGGTLSLCAGWHALPAELLVRILTCDDISGSDLSRCAATCRSWRAVELEHRAKLWQAACIRYGMRQVGTRRRGWQKWRDLFISLCCIECTIPAAHVFNLGAATTPPGVLRWAGTRIPVCELCCACFHDFPRTHDRWRQHGLQDASVHRNFCNALRKRARVEGLHRRSSRKRAPAASVDLTGDD